MVLNGVRSTSNYVWGEKMTKERYPCLVISLF